MTVNGPKRQPRAEGDAHLLEIFERSLAAENLEALSETLLPEIRKFLDADSGFLYVVSPHLSRPYFWQWGCHPEMGREIRNRCNGEFGQMPTWVDQEDGSAKFPSLWKFPTALDLHLLKDESRCVGVVGRAGEQRASRQPLTETQKRLLHVVSQLFIHLIGRVESECKLLHLNTYLTVSSMLAQSLELNELLEIVLYCSMEAVGAEAASVLLLDDEKENFAFYQVEGPAKTLLKGETFPADTGVAGSVLKTEEPLIINDLERDPRFYENIDLKTGFHTRNMIAVPLIAGEEKIGVLEVLNKIDQGSFVEEERLLLISIAEEIALAIRNAKIFDYVVKSYCKRLQGQFSCKGCHRPLGSWTPCQRYRAEKM